MPAAERSAAFAALEIEERPEDRALSVAMGGGGMDPGLPPGGDRERLTQRLTLSSRDAARSPTASSSAALRANRKR